MLDSIRLKGEFKYNIKLMKNFNTVIGTIPVSCLEEFAPRYDEVGTVKLKIYETIANGTGQLVTNPIYKEIKGERIIAINDKYKFVIKEAPIKIEKTKKKGDFKYKNVIAYSFERKLKDRFITLEGNTRQLYRPTNDNVNVSEGVLNWFETETSWKINHVDESARFEHINGGTSIKYRWFEPTDITWYDFLTGQIQTAFNVVIIFNTWNKTIDVYDRETFGKHSGFFLGDNFVIDEDISIGYQDAVTRLNVVGKDGLTISGENPLGTEFIEDFTNLISEGNLSKELEEALDRYDTLAEEKLYEWQLLKNEKDELIDGQTQYTAEIKALDEQINGIQSILSGYIASTYDSSGNIVPAIDSLRKQTQEELASKVALRQQKRNDLDAINQDISDIQQQINLVTQATDKTQATDSQGKIFTEELLSELDDLIIEKTYTDSYYLTSYGLFQGAKDVLAYQSVPYTEKSYNVTDFFNLIKHPKGEWDEIITMGSLIQTDDGIGDKSLRVLGWVHQPNQNKLNILLSNKEKRRDFGISDIGNVGKKSNNTTNILDRWKYIWDTSKDSNDFVNKMISEGLDLSANMVRGRGFRNRIDISEVGIFISDAENEDNQMYIGSSLIGQTQDSWQSCTWSLTAGGLVAENLIGKIILSTKIYIVDESGQFIINGSGLHIKDSDGVERVFLGIGDDGKAKLALYSKGSNRLIISEDGILMPYVTSSEDNIDNSHGLSLDFRIPENATSIYKVELAFSLKRFRAFSSVSNSAGYTTTTTAQNTSTTTGQSSATTSSENGSHRHLMFKYANTTGSPPDMAVPYYFSDNFTGVFNDMVYLSLHSFPRGDWGSDYQPKSEIFTHGSSGSHSHEFAHTHQYLHDHQIVINSHFHELVFNIYESNLANNIRIKVDGILYPATFNADGNIDITNIINWTVGWHTVELVTTGGLGRVRATLFAQYFGTV